MTDFTIAEKNLKERGYSVRVFQTKEEAASYLNEEIDGLSVGFGGSATIDAMGLFDSLSSHNSVHWHWKQPDEEARAAAALTDVYISSANAIAETGEIINIDGKGNRVASTLFGHKKLYIVAGRNKIEKTYDAALYRARNIAAPKRAQQMNRNTPCAVNGDKCYDCRSEERVCNGLVVLWHKMLGMDTEIVFIDDDLGL